MALLHTHLHLRQFPWRAVFLGRELRGFGVTDDHFLHRVPLDLPSGANGNVAEVAHGGRAVPDGHVADGQLAAFDALEPVLVMLGALVQRDVDVLDWLLEHTRPGKQASEPEQQDHPDMERPGDLCRPASEEPVG